MNSSRCRTETMGEAHTAKSITTQCAQPAAMAVTLAQDPLTANSTIVCRNLTVACAVPCRVTKGCHPWVVETHHGQHPLPVAVARQVAPTVYPVTGRVFQHTEPPPHSSMPSLRPFRLRQCMVGRGCTWVPLSTAYSTGHFYPMMMAVATAELNQTGICVNATLWDVSGPEAGAC